MTHTPKVDQRVVGSETHSLEKVSPQMAFYSPSYGSSDLSVPIVPTYTNMLVPKYTSLGCTGGTDTRFGGLPRLTRTPEALLMGLTCVVASLGQL